MNKKLQAILALKTKLIKMQRDLDDVTGRKQNLNPQIITFKQKNQSTPDYNSVPITMNVPQSSSWKNPTFWGESPINGKQNQLKSGWKKKQNNRGCAQLSPKLRDLQKSADSQYYSKQNNQVQDQKMHEPDIKYFPSKRYEHSFYGFPQRETPRFQKIRTYDSAQINQLINFRSYSPKHQGKKIVRKIQKSPKNMLTQNPHSNPNVYFFEKKETSLSPKSSFSATKNRSPLMRQILSPSLENKPKSPTKNPSRGNKKHFSKYFTQTYQCNWV